MTGKFSKTVLFLLLNTCSPILYGQTVEVAIGGFRSTNGKVIVSVFIDNKSFQEEKPFETKTFNKSDIVNGILKTSFTLKPGEYGMCLLDDENGDGRMKYNIIGIPKEGYGFSNFVHSGFSRPVLDDFKFTVTENKTTRVIMRVQYF